MSATVISFGCRLNLAEGEAIAQATRHLNSGTVINSCGVTAEAARQARQAIRRAARARPHERILVTGCAAQHDPESFAAMPEVAAIIPNAAKRDPASYGGHGPATPVGFARSGASHARAFLEVQHGCNHACTFCMIPLARGPSVSAEPDQVIEAARAALDEGAPEVVLTGVDLSGFAGGLGRLCERLLEALPHLRRLRLSSLDPIEVDPVLAELFASHDRLMPHLHLSLQAGHDLILKRMRRRHRVADAERLVDRLRARRAGLAVGADIIAGFPTESEAHADATRQHLARLGLEMLHVFPFSPRTHTPAARMPQVPSPLIRERAATLRADAATRHARWLDSLVGAVAEVAVEKDGRSGYAPGYARVTLPPSPPRHIVATRIIARDGERLIGVAA